MVGTFYCHNEIAEALLTPEPQQPSVEEMSAKYRARLQEKADAELHRKLSEEASKKSIAEQKAWLQDQQAKEKAHSEKERANFIEHHRDQHWPIVAQ